MSESTAAESPVVSETKPNVTRTARQPIATVTTVAHTEIGGRDGPEPTRYGDWEKNGRCIDF
jgi:hypothetical protein